MVTFLTASSVQLMFIFFVALLMVKSSNADRKSILFFSFLLIALTISHFASSGTIESLLALLSKQSKYSEKEIEAAKKAVTIWNLIIPFLVGGLGVNMLNTWLTTPTINQTQHEIALTSRKQEIETLKISAAELKIEHSLLVNRLADKEAEITLLKQQIEKTNQNYLRAPKWKKRVATEYSKNV